MSKIKIVEKSNKPITVILCLPGNNYSGTFLEHWSEFLIQCTKSNIIPLLSHSEGSMVHFVRAKCLGGDVLRGKNQKPFDGKINYDYLMWIDSDIIFNFKQFKKLIDRNVNMISGLYMMQGNQVFAAVQNWDIEYFKKYGSFQFLTLKDVENKTDLIETAYVGFGFLLMKYGVAESLEYPWFTSIDQKITSDIVDISSEDVSFCKRVRQKGYKIFIDPTVRVGHEKRNIL